MQRSLWLSLLLAASLLAACSSSARSTRRGERAPRALEATPVAAFLVYEVDQTVVLPVDGRPSVRADGTWVVHAADPARVVHYGVPVDGPSVGLRACACGNEVGACLDHQIARTIEVRDGFRVSFDPACSCWATHTAVDYPEQPAYPSTPSGFSLAPCEPTPRPHPDPHSMVGGVLSWTDSGSPLNQECVDESQATNAYDLWGSALELAGLRQSDIRVEGQEACTDTLFDDTSWDALTPCAASDAEDGEDDDWDDVCARAELDFSFLVLESGRVCRVELGVSVVGEESTCVRCAAASPDRCPSALDPCGDPTPFREALDESDGPWWVATDGSHALTPTHLIGRDGTRTPIDDGPHDASIGVLYVEDARYLLEAIAHDFTIESSPLPDGERCQNDADCDAAGLCGAPCTNGRCGPVPTGVCTAEHPCDGDFECVDGACVECRTDGDCRDGLLCWDGACGAADCDADRHCTNGEVCRERRCVAERCDPSLDARALGNACAVQMRAEAWDAAARLCECALAASPAPRTEGAIRYNLGRIEEGRGNRTAARRHYERSLEVRPGNAAVRARLDALGDR